MNKWEVSFLAQLRKLPTLRTSCRSCCGSMQVSILRSRSMMADVPMCLIIKSTKSSRFRRKSTICKHRQSNNTHHRISSEDKLLFPAGLKYHFHVLKHSDCVSCLLVNMWLRVKASQCFLYIHFLAAAPLNFFFFFFSNCRKYTTAPSYLHLHSRIQHWVGCREC